MAPMLGLILALPLPSQDLPAEVILLSRVKRHIEDELKRLSNISCLETIAREYQPGKGKMRPLDTVRLEVLADGPRELYASPGDRHFSESPPSEWVGSGAIGNGFFGIYLHMVFLTGNISYSWKGYEQAGGGGTWPAGTTGCR